MDHANVTDVVKGYCGFSYATKTKKYDFRVCSVHLQRRVMKTQ